MSTKFIFAILCGLLFLAPSCKKQENIRIKLTSRERALIDTMYTERIKVLRPAWDSICTNQHDSLITVLLDSIIRIRKEEEIKLRARLVKEVEALK
jgi:hypothetical protein